MLRTGLYRATLTFAVVAMSVVMLSAQELPAPDYSVTYYTNIQISPHGSIHIINPGTYDNNLTTSPSTYGDLCAMIYVFNVDEEMQECCGCLTTPNDLKTIPITALTSNPGNGAALTSGVIKLVSAVPNVEFFNSRTNTNTLGCDPTGTVPSNFEPFFQPVPELRAWATHIQATSAISGQLTEEEFADANLSASEQTFLTSTCGGIIGTGGVGSGKGRCTCGSGF